MSLTARMLRRVAMLLLLPLLCGLSSVFSVEPGGSVAAAAKASSRDQTLKAQAKGERMTYPPNFESPLPLTPLQKERAWMYHLLWWSISRCLCDTARKV
jgi:hypothetical protein